MSYWRARQIAEFFGVSTQTIYNWAVRDPGFPKPAISLPRYVAWRRQDIEGYAYEKERGETMKLIAEAVGAKGIIRLYRTMNKKKVGYRCELESTGMKIPMALSGDPLPSDEWRARKRFGAWARDRGYSPRSIREEIRDDAEEANTVSD